MRTIGFLEPRTLLSACAASVYLASASVVNAQNLVVENHDTGHSQRSHSVDKSVPLAKATPKLTRLGTQVSLNGRMLPVTWSQWRQGKSVRTGISDTGLMQKMGVELLNTNNSTQQPVQWFSRRPALVTALLSGSYRYLDITNFARTAGWRLQLGGNTLQISTPSARVTNLRQSPQPGGSSEVPSPQRLVVDLDRPTPWQVSHERNQAIVTIDASAAPALIERFNPPLPCLLYTSPSPRD